MFVGSAGRLPLPVRDRQLTQVVRARFACFQDEVRMRAVLLAMVAGLAGVVLPPWKSRVLFGLARASCSGVVGSADMPTQTTYTARRSSGASSRPSKSRAAATPLPGPFHPLCRPPKYGGHVAEAGL